LKGTSGNLRRARITPLHFCHPITMKQNGWTTGRNGRGTTRYHQVATIQNTIDMVQRSDGTYERKGTGIHD